MNKFKNKVELTYRAYKRLVKITRDNSPAGKRSIGRPDKVGAIIFRINTKRQSIDKKLLKRRSTSGRCPLHACLSLIPRGNYIARIPSTANIILPIIKDHSLAPSWANNSYSKLCTDQIICNYCTAMASRNLNRNANIKPHQNLEVQQWNTILRTKISTE